MTIIAEMGSGREFTFPGTSSFGPPDILRPGQPEVRVLSLRPAGLGPRVFKLYSLGSDGTVREELASKRVNVVAPIDPEDMFGPDGYDPPGTPQNDLKRFVSEEDFLEYRIEVWNREDAKVPPVDVIVENTLDPSIFDLKTLEFTDMGFLEWDVPVVADQAVNTRVDARPKMNLAVDARADIDLSTGRIEFWLHGVDPITGDYPEDPFVGILPPINRETGYEIAWFAYRVKPNADLPSGTQIANRAFGEFDFMGDRYDNPAPPDGPWINTLDAGPPESHVAPLESATNSTVFPITWTGQDDAGGSGIVGYDIYVRTDDDPFELWLNDTTDTEALFTGSSGHQYAFYSVATDNVGHREAAPDMPDTQTTINIPPTADPGGPYSVAEGGLIALDASASSDPEQTDNTSLTYEWDFDYDGLTFDVDATGMLPDFSASVIDGPATRTIGLRVTDDGGLTDTAMTTVDVANVAPTATITGSPTTSLEAVEIVLGGSAADPAPADTTAAFSYSWTVTKDGVAHDSGTGDTFRFTPNDDGSYQATLIATDKDGGVSDPATATIFVTNVAPTIIIEGGDTVVEGSEYSLTLGTITDPGDDTVTQWIVHWGDALSDTYDSSGDRTHAYENDGTYTITVDLMDEDGTHAGAGSLDLTVTPAGPEAIDLGRVDFLALGQLSLAAGSLFYRIETSHDGVFTSQVDVPTPPKSARLKLYDADPVETVGLTPLVKSALDENGNQRIDWPVTSGETYYVEAYGSSDDFDVRMANLLHHDASNSIVTVQGTDSDDTFEFDAAASRDVTINGVRYHFEDAEVEVVTFDGGHGYDTVILDDSVGNDTLTAEAKHAVFSNSDQTSGFTVTLDDFEELHAYARSGGTDKAFLYDSDAKDKFKSEPAENYAKMYGGRMYNRVKFFDVVEAFSSGEKDLARLFDTQGNDTFEGQQEISWLRTDLFDVGVHNFRRVIAYSNEGGNDEATLKDSVLGDELHLKNHKSEIFDLQTKGEVYKITARRFDTVFGDASLGDGYDKVKMWETPRDNLLEADDDWARMFVQKDELEMLYDVLAFEFVKVRASTGGNDSANVADQLDFMLQFDEDHGWNL